MQFLILIVVAVWFEQNIHLYRTLYRYSYMMKLLSEFPEMEMSDHVYECKEGSLQCACTNAPSTMSLYEHVCVYEKRQAMVCMCVSTSEQAFSGCRMHEVRKSRFTCAKRVLVRVQILKCAHTRAPYMRACVRRHTRTHARSML